jgi:hypothetical protein
MQGSANILVLLRANPRSSFALTEQEAMRDRTEEKKD